MNCDPNSLISAASCYRCIPSGKQGSALIYLLCQWANAESGPTDVYWFPETAVANWTDSGGAHVGDLAAFLATATHPSTTVLTISSQGLSILDGLNFIPLLTDLDCGNNPGLTTLDLSGLTSLSVLLCSQCDITGALNLSPANSLTFVDIGTNPHLTSLDLTGLINLVNLFASNCDFTGHLDCSPATALTYIECVNSTHLTSIDVSGLINLDTLACDGCDITGTLNLNGLLALAVLTCSNNTHLTALTLTGCTALTILSCESCDISVTLDVSHCGAALTYLDCSNNPDLTSIDLSASTGLGSLYCYDCNINPTLDVSPCGAALTIMDFRNNASLVSLLISPLSQNLNFVNGLGCAIPTGGAGGIDDIWNDVASAASILPTNNGFIDISGGTSGTLTGDTGNLDWQTLDGLGWTQAFNP